MADPTVEFRFMRVTDGNNSSVRSSFVLYLAIVAAGLIAAVAVAIAHG
jgi:hypothetical protein